MSYRRNNPHDTVTLEARNIDNERTISHLTRQNDYLHGHINELEKKLEATIVGEHSARQQAASADFEKSMLHEHLRVTDAELRKSSHDKHTVVEIADRELDEAKNELIRTRNEQDKLDIMVTQLQTDNENLLLKNETLTKSLKLQTADLEGLEGLVDKLQEDKKKLSVRCNKLITTEKELVGEIDRVKRRRGGDKSCTKRNRSPNRFDQFIKSVEQDRDYWKSEVETLQQVIKYKRIGETAYSPSKHRSKSSTRKSSDRALSPSKSVRESKLESALKTAEDERDYYKREFELYKSLTSRPSLKLSPRDVEVGGDSELRRVMRERDELQSLLDKFERHMAEIQTNVKVLTSERDRLAQLHQEAKNELQKSRHELLSRSQPTTHPQLNSAHTVINTIEKERDEALVDLRRTMIERDSLRERFKVSSDTHVSDRAHLEQQNEDLNTRINIINKDKNQLELQITNLRSQLTQLEDELRLKTAKEQELYSNVDQHKSSITQMKVLANEREDKVSDLQRNILLKEDDIQSYKRKCGELEDRLINSNRITAELRNEIDMKNSELAEILRERDTAQHQLSETSSKCHHLSNEVNQSEDKNTQYIRNNKELRSQLEGADETVKYKEREIHELKNKLQEYSDIINELKRKRTKTHHEIQLLEEDLATLSRENDRLNADLQDVLTERQQLAEQVQEYVEEVKRVENILAQKEDERVRYLNQYKQTSAECERYESTSSRLELERSSLKSMVLNKESEIKKLSDKVINLDKECHQNRLAQQAMDSQLNSQEKTISALEDKLGDSEKERYALRDELVSTRDSVVKLDSTRDELERLLASKEMELNKSHITISNLEREIHTLKERNNSDRHRLASLEQTISSNRDKDFQSQLAIQESSSEVQLLKERVAINDSKIDSQTREAGQLRNRIAELEADLERARRHVTNEKFEKERALQELRRSGSTTPLGRSGYTTPLDQISPIRNGGLSRHRTSSPRSIHNTSQSGDS